MTLSQLYARLQGSGSEETYLLHQIQALQQLNHTHPADLAPPCICCCSFQPPLFTAAEKTMIRRVFLMWANAQLTAYMSPSPAGTMNNPVLLTGARGIANNYASAHMRQLAYYALSFNVADDTAVDPKLPEVSASGQYDCQQGNHGNGSK